MSFLPEEHSIELLLLQHNSVCPCFLLCFKYHLDNHANFLAEITVARAGMEEFQFHFVLLCTNEIITPPLTFQRINIVWASVLLCFPNRRRCICSYKLKKNLNKKMYQQMLRIIRAVLPGFNSLGIYILGGNSFRLPDCNWKEQKTTFERLPEDATWDCEDAPEVPSKRIYTKRLLLIQPNLFFLVYIF